MSPDTNTPLGQPTPVTEPQIARAPAYKLFSYGSMLVGTIFGSGFAFIYFMYKNYKNMGMLGKAWTSIPLGLLGFGAIIFGTIFLEDHTSITLNAGSVNGIYIACAMLAIRATQYERVMQHKKSGGEFYSGVRVFIISVLGLLLALSTFVGLLLIDARQNKVSLLDQLSITLSNYDSEKHDRLINEFNANEEKALVVNELPSTTPSSQYIATLDSSVAIFKQNLSILNEIQALPGLPKRLQQDNSKMIEYVNLRIQEFGLLKQEEVEKDYAKYKSEIESIGNRIRAIQKELGIEDTTPAPDMSPSSLTVDPDPLN